LNAIKEKKFECILFISYLAYVITFSFYHEPWRDEAQAWLIAKCDSLYEILFVTPHYEGHPSLWYLILFPFAKLGMNYEVSLKFVNIAISSIAVLLILFRFDIPKIVKFLIVTNRSVLCQISLVCRPYCLVLLAFVILALNFPERREKPIPFFISIMFLCMTHMICLMLAGIISFIYMLETIKDKTFKKKLKLFILLFLYAVIILLQIFPASDQQFANDPEINRFGTQKIYLFFNFINYALTSLHIENIIAILVAYFLINISLCKLFKENGKYYIFPLLGFSLFYTLIYIQYHLSSIVVSLVIFNLLISKYEVNTQKTGLYIVIMIMAVWYLCVDIYMGRYEKLYDYGAGRAIASYIKENNLEDKVIFVDYYPDGCTDCYSLNPYFNENNIIDNLNMDNRNKGYMIWRDTALDIKKIHEIGSPDVFITEDIENLKTVFNFDNIDEYTKEKEIETIRGEVYYIYVKE